MDTTTAQAVPDFGVFEQLANYGALGIVSLAVGALVWFLIKKNLAEKDRLQAKIDELEKELRNR
jgi:hypothetical protein